MANKPPFVGERVKLSDLCSKGKSALRQKDVLNNGPYPVYGASGVIGTMSAFQNEVPYVCVVKDGAGVGRVMACEACSSVLGTMQALIPKDGVDNDYLLHLVRSMKLGEGFSGSTIPHIYFKDYCKRTVQSLSFAQQVKVSSVFRLVELLMGQNKLALDILDQLVKSRFVEMFGDPLSNPYSFKTEMGLKLFKMGNGKTKPEPERFESGIPAFGGNGISWYSKDSLVDFPTIVIGRVGRHCGNTRLVCEPCWVTDNAMYIKEFLGESFNLVFLDELMKVVGFNKYADQGDLWKITQQPFMEFEYLVPPLALQQQFADFVAQVDKSRFVGLGSSSLLQPRALWRWIPLSFVVEDYRRQDGLPPSAGRGPGNSLSGV